MSVPYPRPSGRGSIEAIQWLETTPEFIASIHVHQDVAPLKPATGYDIPVNGTAIHVHQDVAPLKLASSSSAVTASGAIHVHQDVAPLKRAGPVDQPPLNGDPIHVHQDVAPLKPLG